MSPAASGYLKKKNGYKIIRFFTTIPPSQNTEHNCQRPLRNQQGIDRYKMMPMYEGIDWSTFLVLFNKMTLHPVLI